MANDSIDELHYFDLYTVTHIGDENFFKRFDAKIINTPNAEGWTLLMYACNNGNFEFVDFLLKQGASTSIKSKDEKTPLLISIGGGDLRSTKAVFSLDLLEYADARGWTPLFYAVYYGRETCAEFLLLQGANPHVVDNKGQTPVSIAVKYGMESMVATLLRGTTSKTPKKNTLLSPSYNQAIQTPKRGFNIFQPMRTFSPNKPHNIKKDIKENFSPVLPKTTSCNTPQNKPPVSPIIKISLPKQSNVTPLKEISSDQKPKVLVFLTDIGMAKYWSIFQEEEVDFETFITFDEENLKEIGISLYGPRRKISMAIQEFRAIHGSGSRLLKNARWNK